MKQLNDTMTPEIREQLRAFFAGLESTGSAYAPPLGHFEPDMIFDADQDEDRGAFNPSLASQEPSPHWHDTQTALDFPGGSQGPLEGQQRAGLVVTALCLFVAAGLVVVGVLAFVVLFWPFINQCYLKVSGC